jgi:hypothetical protein
MAQASAAVGQLRKRVETLKTGILAAFRIGLAPNVPRDGSSRGKVIDGGVG